MGVKDRTFERNVPRNVVSANHRLRTPTMTLEIMVNLLHYEANLIVNLPKSIRSTKFKVLCFVENRCILDFQNLVFNQSIKVFSKFISTLMKNCRNEQNEIDFIVY